MIARIFAVAGLLIAAHAAAQQTVYKSIDANGNVTYSSTPPPDAARAEAIELTPSPAPTEIEAAQQRAQALQELGDQASSEREERSAQLAEARQAAREEAARQQPAEPPSQAASYGGYGWGFPIYPGYQPGYLRPGVRPPWPERPAPPPPARRPMTKPNHPAYWPRQPVRPPDIKPRPRGGLKTLPPPQTDRPR
jgi:hypothetical protein